MLFAIIANIVLVLIVLGGLIAPYFGVLVLKRRAQVKGTPVTRIGHACSGPVAVEGRAKAVQPMVGPFSGRPCVYVEAHVEVLSGGGQGKKSMWIWTPHATIHRKYPFYVEDGSGSVLVATADTQTHMDVPETFQLKNADDNTGRVVAPPPPSLLSMLDEHGIPWLDEDGNVLGLRFVEHAIEDGASLYVIGEYSHRDEDVRDALDPVDAASRPRVSAVVTAKDEHNRAYVSLGGRDEIVRRLLWQGLGCIVGGPLASVAAAGFLYLVYTL